MRITMEKIQQFVGLKFGLARYVGCRRVDFVAQTATFCVVLATCRQHVSVMSPTRLDVVSARVSSRQLNVVLCHAI